MNHLPDKFRFLKTTSHWRGNWDGTKRIFSFSWPNQLGMDERVDNCQSNGRRARNWSNFTGFKAKEITENTSYMESHKQSKWLHKPDLTRIPTIHRTYTTIKGLECVFINIWTWNSYIFKFPNFYRTYGPLQRKPCNIGNVKKQSKAGRSFLWLSADPYCCPSCWLFLKFSISNLSTQFHADYKLISNQIVRTTLNQLSTLSNRT